MLSAPAYSALPNLEEAQGLLLDQIDRWLKVGHPAQKAKTVVRLEQPVQALDPLSWLVAQPHPQRTYWTDRSQREKLAGIGEAWCVQSVAETPYREVMHQLAALLKEAPPEARFLGGLRFDPKAFLSPEWQAWGAARFVLPEIVLEERESQHWLVCQVVRREDPSEEWTVLKMLRQRLAALRPAWEQTPAPFSFHRRRNHPEQPGWEAMVTEGLKLIESGELSKVVLARCAEFELASPSDPVQLLWALREKAPEAFHFCFQREENQAFLGITPERLFQREGRQLQSEALASTRPRGATPEEDEQLAEELRTHPKEQREHLMVLTRLEALLEQFCGGSERLSYLESLRLTHVQHLRSRVRGKLQETVQDEDLLPAFHPTPAVSGTPNEAALGHIRRLEPFDRGWYAGPIGWVSRDAAEFAVALRSGLLSNRTLRVYTGAGVVEGSEPEKEWQEIESKLRSWASLLVQA